MHFTANTDPTVITKQQLGPFKKWKSRRTRPICDVFWERVQIGNPNDCWPFGSAKHYGNFYAPFEDGSKVVKAHRFAWILTNGEIPDGMYVLHKCDNPRCCNPNHLFIGTHRDNMDDMANKGRKFKPIGELSPTHKITAQDAVDIRLRYDPSKNTYGQIAKEFGISPQSVREIVKAVTWKNVFNPERKTVYNRGQAHPKTKLTEEDVIKMRQLYQQGGYSQSELGRMFGITCFGARGILMRRTWKHI